MPSEPKIYHCNICGGDVSFPQGAKPSIRIGVGNPGRAARETPAMKLLGVDIEPPCSCGCYGPDPFCWHHGIVAKTESI